MPRHGNEVEGMSLRMRERPSSIGMAATCGASRGCVEEVILDYFVLLGMKENAC